MRTGDLLAGRYRLDEFLASGAMGSVWKGHDDRLDRVIAIKIMHAKLSRDAEFKARFQAEARALAKLKAPGIVAVHDYGTDIVGGVPMSYLVMEFVKGQSLQEVLSRGGRLRSSKAVSGVAAVARALHAAHQAGIIHRDVKPANILMTESGDPRIVDFGIAREVGRPTLGLSSMVMGTPGYMSPEQLRGKDPTPATDIYALGVVAYECLTGHLPFEGDQETVVKDTLSRTPPPLPGHVSRRTAEIVMRALEKDPGKRWPSAADFAAALPGQGSGRGTTTRLPHADATRPTIPPTKREAPAARPSTPKPPTPPPVKRAKPPSPTPSSSGGSEGWVAILVGLLILGGIWYLNSDTDDKSPSDDGSSSYAYSYSPADTAPETTAAQQVAVPDVVGVDEGTAYATLSGSGFYNVDKSEILTGDLSCVTAQVPAAGEERTTDTEVTLYVTLYASSDPTPTECL